MSKKSVSFIATPRFFAIAKSFIIAKSFAIATPRFFAIASFIAACFIAQPLLAQRYIIPTRFAASPTPPMPNYADVNAWAALPDRQDPADLCPKGCTDNQANAQVDVFFIHPTTFVQKPKTQYKWNADIRDIELNKNTDQSPIKYQTSVFNAAGKIYAPRYRQAHYSVFLTQHLDDKKAALDTAYSDIEQAFLYYLKHYNHDRPFIIASHSQGTIHAARIVKEHVLGTPLQSKLVTAYLIGMAVPFDSLPGLPVCKNETETGCFVSWCTYERDYLPPAYPLALERAVCVNPLSWEYNQNYIEKSQHQGAIFYRFEKILPQICDAQVHGGILWVTKPKFPGSRFWHEKNYHIGDINLFYLDIRNNAVKRANAYLSLPH